MTNPHRAAVVERMAEAVRAGRLCGTARDPLHPQCPFCLWPPPESGGEADSGEVGCIWIANNALTTLLSYLAEIGWTLAPLVATREMQDFGQDADPEDLGAGYAAMLAAAPALFAEERNIP